MHHLGMKEGPDEGKGFNLTSLSEVIPSCDGICDCKYIEEVSLRASVA